MRGEIMRAIREGLHGALVIAAKDVRIYYAKPPVIMWGMVFPFLLFLSWSVGRHLPIAGQIPALLAVAVFFTASSIGPVVIPWEKRAGTFDRLVVAPVPLWGVLSGKTLAGMVFGLAVAALVTGLGVLAGVRITNAGALLLGILLSAGAFASLGVLFSTIPARDVAAVMMPATLVRWPLLFVSGLFVPLDELPAWGRALAYASPLTYTNDLFHGAMGGPRSIHVAISLGVLSLYWMTFLLIGLGLHEVGRRRA
jgi:ABC-2 type transport system permease protein